MAIAKRPVPALRSSKIMFNVNIQHIANPSSTICSVFNIEGMRKESDELAWNSWSIKVAKSTLNNWMSKILQGKVHLQTWLSRVRCQYHLYDCEGQFYLVQD